MGIVCEQLRIDVKCSHRRAVTGNLLDYFHMRTSTYRQRDGRPSQVVKDNIGKGWIDRMASFDGWVEDAAREIGRPQRIASWRCKHETTKV